MLFEAWGDALRSTCGCFSPVPAGRQKAVQGHFTTRRVSGLDLADFRCDIRMITRSPRDIRADDHEHLFLLVQIEGRSHIEADGNRSIVTPGMLYLLNSTRPLKIDYDGAVAHSLSLHLPRAALLSGAGPALRVGQAIDASSEPARLLHRRISGVMRGTEDGDPEQVFDLARLAFQPDPAGGRQQAGKLTPATRFQLALRQIETHVTHADMSLAWLAARIGVSARQLERDFAAHGSSFVQALRQQRLKLFVELSRLAHRRAQNPQVTDMALAAGFRDISNFNRAFRAYYGIAPRRFLEQAGG